MSSPRKTAKKQYHHQLKKKSTVTPTSSSTSTASSSSQVGSSLENNNTNHKPTTNQNNNEILRSKLGKASELESRLSTLLATKNSETQASKVRIELCAIFSELLVADATFSARKDVCGRMWRACFYGRIVELRNRISKERQRRKKNHNHKKVEEVEGFLQTFIKDAVVLYDYLLKRYHECILESQGMTMTLTQDSQSTTTTTTKTTLSSGVIPTLHKLYIHLGDLHRYASDYNAAETAYLNAAQLAPGKGNPYNQLAVVAQLKDASSLSNGKLANSLAAVSLYWYCRSLLAVNDPFLTAKANMERLFVSNRNWIASQDQSAAFVHGIHIDIHTTSSYSTTGLSREKIRSVKAAASRMFLSRFVDLHWDILNSRVDLTKMNKIWNMFTSLLEESSFSDGLLIKMACINAFSVSNLQAENHHVMVALANLLTFGATLAKHVNKSIVKLDSKLEGKVSPSLIRVFGPFLICFDFISDLCLSKRNNNLLSLPDSKSQLLTESHQRFWNEVTMLANALVDSKAILSILDGSPLFQTNYEEETILPKEYKYIRGYTPFISFAYGETYDSFLQSDEEEKYDSVTSKVGVYVSADEVIQGLDLTQGTFLSQTSKQSQTSNISKNSQVNPQGFAEDTKAKLIRFATILKRHSNLRQCDSNTTAYFVTIENMDQKWIVRNHWEQTNNENLSLTESMVVETSTASLLKDLLESKNQNNLENKLANANNVPVTTTTVDDDDEEGDVVVYKASESGNGPALLVPGALLLGSKSGISNQNSNLSIANDSNCDSSFSKKDEKSPNLLEVDKTPNDSNNNNNTLNLSLMLNQTSSKPTTLLTSTPSRSVIESSENSSCGHLSDRSNCRAYELPQSMPPKKPTVQPPPGFSSSSMKPMMKDTENESIATNVTNHSGGANLAFPPVDKVAPAYQHFGQNMTHSQSASSFHQRSPPGFNQVTGAGMIVNTPKADFHVNHNASQTYSSQGHGFGLAGNDVNSLANVHEPYEQFNLHTANPFAMSQLATNNDGKNHFEFNDNSLGTRPMYACQNESNNNHWLFSSNGQALSSTSNTNQKNGFEESGFDFGSNLNNKDLLGTVDLFGLKSLGIFSSGDTFFEDAHTDTKNDTDLQSELHLNTQNPFVAP